MFRFIIICFLLHHLRLPILLHRPWVGCLEAGGLGSLERLWEALLVELCWNFRRLSICHRRYGRVLRNVRGNHYTVQPLFCFCILQAWVFGLFLILLIVTTTAVAIYSSRTSCIMGKHYWFWHSRWNIQHALNVRTTKMWRLSFLFRDQSSTQDNLACSDSKHIYEILTFRLKGIVRMYHSGKSSRVLQVCRFHISHSGRCPFIGTCRRKVSRWSNSKEKSPFDNFHTFFLGVAHAYNANILHESLYVVLACGSFLDRSNCHTKSHRDKADMCKTFLHR